MEPITPIIIYWVKHCMKCNSTSLYCCFGNLEDVIHYPSVGGHLMICWYCLVKVILTFMFQFSPFIFVK